MSSHEFNAASVLLKPREKQRSSLEDASERLTKTILNPKPALEDASERLTKTIRTGLRLGVFVSGLL